MGVKEIESHLLSTRGHVESFERGTKGSATKARASLQLIKKECDKLRQELLVSQKAMPKRVKKIKVDKKVEKP